MSTSAFRSPPERVAAHVRALPRSGIRDFFDIVSTMRDVISLGIGEPDFDTPWRVREAAIYALERGATHYTSNLGLLRLRRAICEFVRQTYGVEYDPETECIVTVGVSEAVDLAVRALVSPGDGVMFHQPCYVSYEPLVRLAHGDPLPVPTTRETGFRLTRQLLEEHTATHARLLVLNFPNNPTGAALDRTELEEVARFAIERDLIVLTDEIYGELRYEGEPVSIAAIPGMRERCVFLHGFSKAFAMTGFRLGFACAPAPLVEAMMKIHQYTMLCAPTLSQEAAIEALNEPERDVAPMREEYRARRNFLLHAFSEIGLPVVEPRGAFYMFPYVGHLGLSSREFALKLLEEERVAVVPGDVFGPTGAGHVRCSYATAMDDLQEAVRRIGAFVARLAPVCRLTV
ncbi:MAG: aminotransferase class I/II-fold pyridoxal phosphate-dependent enzyme [Kiritimatiellae bacterium]|nr:aminotransferase class I/II-fold pyridoxal phosphate-dependent enzyme [Kiritimatiellia bacterium]